MGKNVAQKLRFIGYTDTAGNYRVWDETKQKCYIRHDVLFNESDFGKSSHPPEQEVSEEPAKDVQISLDKQEDAPEREEEQPDTEPLRRSDRVRKPCVRYGIDEYVDVACHIAFQATEIEEPSTIEEALTGNNSKEWKEAADSEYRSL